jgi:hypothetical protein
LSIINTFSVDIAIAKTDLIKYIVGDSKIVETGSVIEEVMRIGYYRYLSSLITPYKVRIIAYCFYNIEILAKDAGLGTITAADEEPYNLTTIGVYTAIDLDIKAC